MKFLFVLAILIVVPFTNSYAVDVIKDQQGGSYVPFENFKLSMADSLFEMFAGKFQEVKDSYCATNAKQACKQKLIMTTCKGNVNQSEGSCPEACKAWARDCSKTDTQDIVRKFGEDIPAGE